MCSVIDVVGVGLIPGLEDEIAMNGLVGRTALRNG